VPIRSYLDGHILRTAAQSKCRKTEIVVLGQGILELTPMAERRIFRLEPRNLTNWGDYGTILQHGMTTHMDRDQGMLQLWRTGPFVPPMTFPGLDFLVDDQARKAIENSGIPSLRSIAFRPVLKAKIIPSDWLSWDLASDDPAQYPDSGEPEAYLQDEAHDASLAGTMPDLWEVLLSKGAREDRESRNDNGIPLHRRSWNGCDWFGGDTTLYRYVTQRARDWIEPRYAEWVSFREVEYSEREWLVPVKREELGR